MLTYNQMTEFSDEDFNRLMAESLDELPQEFVSRLDNVLITFEDNPTMEQRAKLKLRGNHTLLGLYEGVPLTKRNNSYNMVLPDKITLFKQPILQFASSEENLKRQIKHTLWHEIAHYFGLDHDRIHEIEANWK